MLAIKALTNTQSLSYGDGGSEVIHSSQRCSLSPKGGGYEGGKKTA